MNSLTWIVLVNYRRSMDTVSCVASLLALNVDDWACVVYENGSGDDSYQEISSGLRSLSLTTVAVEGNRVTNVTSFRAARGQQIFVVEGMRNLGFAGGNNAALRGAESVGLRRPDFVWFLNNDTVVDENCLQALLDAADSNSRKVGIIGATLLHFDEPNRVQCFGGARYCPFTGQIKEMGKGSKYSAALAREHAHFPIDYISGASMFVRRSFLEDVGTMSEDYFLYFEELDWSVRASQLGYGIAYAPDAIVWHKEGSALGSGSAARRSYVAEFFGLRSRLRFTAKHYPICFPTVYCGGIVQLGKRLVTGRWRQARAIGKALLMQERP